MTATSYAPPSRMLLSMQLEFCKTSSDDPILGQSDFLEQAGSICCLLFKKAFGAKVFLQPTSIMGICSWTLLSSRENPSSANTSIAKNHLLKISGVASLPIFFLGYFFLFVSRSYQEKMSLYMSSFSTTLSSRDPLSSSAVAEDLLPAVRNTKLFAALLSHLSEVNTNTSYYGNGIPLDTILQKLAAEFLSITPQEKLSSSLQELKNRLSPSAYSSFIELGLFQQESFPLATFETLLLFFSGNDSKKQKAKLLFLGMRNQALFAQASAYQGDSKELLALFSEELSDLEKQQSLRTLCLHINEQDLSDPIHWTAYQTAFKLLQLCIENNLFPEESFDSQRIPSDLEKHYKSFIIDWAMKTLLKQMKVTELSQKLNSIPAAWLEKVLQEIAEEAIENGADSRSYVALTTLTSLPTSFLSIPLINAQIKAAHSKKSFELPLFSILQDKDPLAELLKLQLELATSTPLQNEEQFKKTLYSDPVLSILQDPSNRPQTFDASSLLFCLFQYTIDPIRKPDNNPGGSFEKELQQRLGFLFPQGLQLLKEDTWGICLFLLGGDKLSARTQQAFSPTLAETFSYPKQRSSKKRAPPLPTIAIPSFPTF